MDRNLSLVVLLFFIGKPRGEVSVNVICVSMETVVDHLVPFDFSRRSEEEKIRGELSEIRKHTNVSGDKKIIIKLEES